MFMLVKHTIFACPVWHIGDLYVLDEYGNQVNAKVWKYYSKTDSFRMTKESYYLSSDTNAFEFWTGNYRGGYGKTDIFIRIEAEGYADVSIKSIEFIKIAERRRYPKLVVVMYPKKFIKHGDKFVQISQIVYGKPIIVKDSLTLTMKDYLEFIPNKSTSNSLLMDNSIMSVESYPNPVTDLIILKINSPILEPYKLKLMDINGNIVSEIFLTNNETRYDLSWISKGSYFIQVFEPNGNPIYIKKFIKS